MGRSRHRGNRERRVTAHPPSVTNPGEENMTVSRVTETLVRVNYSETDQMDVAYHARYLVWLDIARTEHLRHCGASYRELEAAGLRLVVSEVAIRYRQPARFDDLVRIRCWVREVASRRVTFGYAVEHAEDGRLLATAMVALLALDAAMALTRLPDQVRAILHPMPDPVPLGLTSEAQRTSRD
jgi:acyl-CoA thioester hydrolase